MVVKLTKNALLFNEVKKEIESKKYQCNFRCNNGEFEKREFKYLVIAPQIENNIVSFNLWALNLDSISCTYYCYIKKDKIIIKDGVLSDNYELIKKLVEKSKFKWEVLIL